MTHFLVKKQVVKKLKKKYKLSGFLLKILCKNLSGRFFWSSNKLLEGKMESDQTAFDKSAFLM